MNVETATARPGGIERLARDLPSFSATKLASGVQAVTHTVMARGAVVITRHDRPSMVLMSVEHYLRMEQASQPSLKVLTYRFDDMFARMQGEAAAQAMAAAFAMTPSELGVAAVAPAVVQAPRDATRR